MIGFLQPVCNTLAVQVPFQPPAASSIAEGVDKLYLVLSGITAFFTVLIFSIILVFMVKYRRRKDDEVPIATHTPLVVELTWTIIPSLICAVLFVWAAALYVQNGRPPASSTEVFVIGKQWMWHLQHPEGPREINELHVPVGVPIKLAMTSQDVIHDFFVPQLRFKQDAVPGLNIHMHFKPTQIGEYEIACAELCGLGHYKMHGMVHVVSQEDFDKWLAAREAEKQ